MYICSFTELKIHKFKNVNSFLGFLDSLSSWSLLFSVWKMNLEHWNYGLSFVWTLITLLFISTYNQGILRILNTFDSWIIKIKIIGDLKDIYFILHSLTIRTCAIQAIFILRHHHHLNHCPTVSQFERLRVTSPYLLDLELQPWAKIMISQELKLKGNSNKNWI